MLASVECGLGEPIDAFQNDYPPIYRVTFTFLHRDGSKTKAKGVTTSPNGLSVYIGRFLRPDEKF
jgi:hypothetical protein